MRLLFSVSECSASLSWVLMPLSTKGKIRDLRGLSQEGLGLPKSYREHRREDCVRVKGCPFMAGCKSPLAPPPIRCPRFSPNKYNPRALVLGGLPWRYLTSGTKYEYLCTWSKGSERGLTVVGLHWESFGVAGTWFPSGGAN